MTTGDDIRAIASAQDYRTVGEVQDGWRENHQDRHGGGYLIHEGGLCGKTKAYDADRDDSMGEKRDLGLRALLRRAYL